MGNPHGDSPWGFPMGIPHGDSPWAIPMGNPHGESPGIQPLQTTSNHFKPLHGVNPTTSNHFKPLHSVNPTISSHFRPLQTRFRDKISFHEKLHNIVPSKQISPIIYRDVQRTPFVDTMTMVTRGSAFWMGHAQDVVTVQGNG